MTGVVVAVLDEEVAVVDDVTVVPVSVDEDRVVGCLEVLPVIGVVVAVLDEEIAVVDDVTVVPVDVDAISVED